MAYALGVRPAGGRRTWTVIDSSYRTVGPVEEWLEAHRVFWSPNTVRGYATSLAQWWTFLEQRTETAGWQAVGVPAVSGFLSWQRNGRTVEYAIAARAGTAPSPETLETRLAALISFYRWQAAVNGVPVAGREAAARGTTNVGSSLFRVSHLTLPGTPCRRENGVGSPADADVHLGVRPRGLAWRRGPTWKGHALLP